MGEGRERWRETEEGVVKSEGEKQKTKKGQKGIVQQRTSNNWYCVYCNRKRNQCMKELG